MVSRRICLTKKFAGIVRCSCYAFEPNRSIDSKWAIFEFNKQYADLSMFNLHKLFFYFDNVAK